MLELYIVFYYSSVLFPDLLHLKSNDEIIYQPSVLKASYRGYFSCRDPKDLLERLDLMESKDLKYF